MDEGERVNKNFIAGEWVEGKRATTDLNPSDLDDRIGDFALADRSQTNDAISAARQAAAAWRDAGIQQRAQALDLIGNTILARKQELGTLLSREEGKTLPEGIGEVERAGQIFKFFAGETLRIPGVRIDSVRRGVEAEVTREPVGVVGIITPWNFPIAIPAWKIAPALAFGNAVVFKPAALVPATARALAEIIAAAGLPAGAFNLVVGAGQDVGETIVESPQVDAVSFTGSVAIGRAILVKTAQRQARVQLEMGGKNP
ncbi:MAG TPA: aldehyde dehydrogenase family protein, partial [Gammaproteobacteria bacterium]|nr:aldehyde dehydrogenase family protein [Gammaproteobacteria bacterium]